MRILFTNHALGVRGGSELWVRDMALELRRRGHEPAAYSVRLGAVAEELRATGIPVVDRLAALPWAPDLLHLHHHLEAMAALVHFPGVPAVYVCHGWRPWEETPCRHPRILEYAAVDQATLDAAVREHGVPADRIRLQLNFVDLARFRPRAPLPARAGRALVFSNYASELTHLPAVRTACSQAGVPLEAIGAGVGNAVARPESVLGAYDLVFAKGRSAIEALAVGAAVVACDATGVGPMITSAEFDRLRRLNFGVATFHSPMGADALASEIARYDAADAQEVSRRLRAEASLEAAADRLLALYGDARARFDPAAIPAQEEARATAEYLRWLSASLHARGAAPGPKGGAPPRAGSLFGSLRRAARRVLRGK